jgi:hypothetical protein
MELDDLERIADEDDIVQIDQDWEEGEENDDYDDDEYDDEDSVDGLDELEDILEDDDVQMMDWTMSIHDEKSAYDERPCIMDDEITSAAGILMTMASGTTSCPSRMEIHAAAGILMTLSTSSLSKSGHVGVIPFSRWERLGDVFPEAGLRVKCSERRAATLKSSIMKKNKSFMMVDSRDEGRLLEVIIGHFSRRGIPVSAPLRGVKYCHACGMIWHRDRNAARNIALIFIYQRFNNGKRPFAFQRSSSGKRV